MIIYFAGNEIAPERSMSPRVVFSRDKTQNPLRCLHSAEQFKDSDALAASTCISKMERLRHIDRKACLHRGFILSQYMVIDHVLQTKILQSILSGTIMPFNSTPGIPEVLFKMEAVKLLRILTEIGVSWNEIQKGRLLPQNLAVVGPGQRESRS